MAAEKVSHSSTLVAAKAEFAMAARSEHESLQVTVFSDSLIHVVARPPATSATEAARPWVLDQAEFCPGVRFQFSQSADLSTMTTARLTVSLSAAGRNLTIKTHNGETLVKETANLPRSCDSGLGHPAETYQVADHFLPEAGGTSTVLACNRAANSTVAAAKWSLDITTRMWRYFCLSRAHNFEGAVARQGISPSEMAMPSRCKVAILLKKIAI